jgi:hypothetical protein
MPVVSAAYQLANRLEGALVGFSGMFGFAFWLLWQIVMAARSFLQVFLVWVIIVIFSLSPAVCLTIIPSLAGCKHAN